MPNAIAMATIVLKVGWRFLSRSAEQAGRTLTKLANRAVGIPFSLRRVRIFSPMPGETCRIINFNWIIQWNLINFSTWLTWEISICQVKNGPPKQYITRIAGWFGKVSTIEEEAHHHSAASIYLHIAVPGTIKRIKGCRYEWTPETWRNGRIWSLKTTEQAKGSFEPGPINTTARLIWRFPSATSKPNLCFFLSYKPPCSLVHFRR